MVGMKKTNCFDIQETMIIVGRSKFHLKQKDKDYIKEKGIEKIREHAHDFINKRLAPENIPNDGKQTPMRGHPVFIAQHATATCCRGCLYKWHKIQKGIELNKEQKDYIMIKEEVCKKNMNWKCLENHFLF